MSCVGRCRPVSGDGLGPMKARRSEILMRRPELGERRAERRASDPSRLNQIIEKVYRVCHIHNEYERHIHIDRCSSRRSVRS